MVCFSGRIELQDHRGSSLSLNQVMRYSAVTKGYFLVRRQNILILFYQIAKDSLYSAFAEKWCSSEYHINFIRQTRSDDRTIS